MLCDNCKTDRLDSDFINNQKFCYQCVYRIKVEKEAQNQTKKIPLCRTCGKEVVRKDNVKKRQRNVFCSGECAEKGHKYQLDHHWTREIRRKDI